MFVVSCQLVGTPTSLVQVSYAGAGNDRDVRLLGRAPSSDPAIVLFVNSVLLAIIAAIGFYIYYLQQQVEGQHDTGALNGGRQHVRGVLATRTIR